jgi:hypothetical protein
LASKIKDKGNGKYVTFKRKALKRDGTPNQPVRVVNDKEEPWDNDVMIGNDSVVNVKFAINEYGTGKNDKALNILSLQVWDLVRFSGSEFGTRSDFSNDWTDEAAA